MDNEIYYSKSQILKVAESLRPIAGNGITDAFIKGIEGAEGEKDHIIRDKVWTGTKLEYDRYMEQNLKCIRFIIDRTWGPELIEAALREAMQSAFEMTEEEKHGPLI